MEREGIVSCLRQVLKAYNRQRTPLLALYLDLFLRHTSLVYMKY